MSSSNQLKEHKFVLTLAAVFVISLTAYVVAYSFINPFGLFTKNSPLPDSNNLEVLKGRHSNRIVELLMLRRFAGDQTKRSYLVGSSIVRDGFVDTPSLAVLGLAGMNFFETSVIVDGLSETTLSSENTILNVEVFAPMTNDRTNRQTTLDVWKTVLLSFNSLKALFLPAESYRVTFDDFESPAPTSENLYAKAIRLREVYASQIENKFPASFSDALGFYQRLCVRYPQLTVNFLVFDMNDYLLPSRAERARWSGKVKSIFDHTNDIAALCRGRNIFVKVPAVQDEIQSIWRDPIHFSVDYGKQIIETYQLNEKPTKRDNDEPRG
ncbi:MULTISPECIES: hypothetical protein [Idiomarina]|uniref:hypothetical protein n=1 Tax=Idiomarina TaxID=135575 RepID=UPI00129C20DF|nr:MULTISPECIES: hypothetical protein [Idiomarina]MRJ42961.1 hypothetical protein [Idiomarina sp. FeN1]NCU58513.1 hypothetical protein [Idiomarina sp. FenA--70]NCU61210.1 hypothetical protein [Idiomarina sp. FenBw--71]UUN12710.1 hypothetical protein KGF88_08585 [Idiomarina loihiensis]